MDHDKLLKRPIEFMDEIINEIHGDKKQDKIYPIAYVRLRVNKEYRVNDWIIDDCPYCHKKHKHGGGSIKDNPRDYLGHRVAHCVPERGRRRNSQVAPIENSAGYILIEKV